MTIRSLAAVTTMAVLSVGSIVVLAQRPAANMSFFVTSANPKGGNLGGLAGGDAFCQSLAQAAGAGGKTWHAYLSTSTVDAKTRIGNGPWYNFKGERIAQQRRRPAQREQQDLRGDGAHRERHDAELSFRQPAGGARGPAVAARHDDRLKRRRYEGRRHVQGLDRR